MESPNSPGESGVERAKRAGRHLRGTIAETLQSGATHFDGDDLQLLKFHGVYQQDDRDRRRERRAEGRAYQFMIRVALPAGQLTAPQYLALDDLTRWFADGTLRITTRQGLQYHGVVMTGLKQTIANVNEHLATTLAACGDVSRNVMGCPAPLGDPVHLAVQRAAAAIAVELRPRSRAYHEIWLDGERVDPASLEPGTASDPPSHDAEEPFYGTQYLPRKFKVAVGLARDNCVDLYAQDVSLVALTRDANVTGYNVLVGGGLGMTHGKGDTIARLAEPLGCVAPEHAVEAARIVAAIFRDHGNRADRRHARLKYLIEAWGIDRFRQEFTERAPFPLLPFEPMPELEFHDHLGPARQHDGRWSYGVYVESGRVADRDSVRIRSALRAIVERLSPGVAFTPHQNVIFTDLAEADLPVLEGILREHGVTPPAELVAVRRYAMACPALPTCGLAVAESERLLPRVLAGLAPELERLGLRDEPISVRLTGCPNGCARPYTADLAFVGRSLGLYHVYVGGGLRGDRVTDLYLADVKVDDLIPAVIPLLTRWAAERQPGEALGDFYQRASGRESHRRRLTGKEAASGPLLTPDPVP